MSTHRHSDKLDGPFDSDHPVDLLVEFYRVNGYELAGDLDDVDVPGPFSAPLSLHRGSPGNGWWTSNMAKLHTTVDIDWDASGIQIDYRVDTTGQMLTSIEQSFWTRELQWAGRYAAGEVNEAVDLRLRESERAQDQTAGLVSKGLWAATIVFFVIIALGMLGIIF